MSTHVRRRVPLVNLAHYRSGPPAERSRFVEGFGAGLKELGFVSVEGHGIDDGRVTTRSPGGPSRSQRR